MVKICTDCHKPFEPHKGVRTLICDQCRDDDRIRAIIPPPPPHYDRDFDFDFYEEAKL